MELFENYDRKIDKINKVMSDYGISSLKEAISSLSSSTTLIFLFDWWMTAKTELEFGCGCKVIGIIFSVIEYAPQLII